MEGPVNRSPPHRMVERIGQELGVSEWIPIPQSSIDAFADLTGDPRQIAALARRFRQHAVVAVSPGHPARIVLGLATPRSTADVDARTRREERR